MEESDFQELLDYMQFKGFDYRDYKPFIMFLDKEREDFDFTNELIQDLIKSNCEELRNYPEDLSDYKEELITCVKEV